MREARRGLEAYLETREDPGGHFATRAMILETQLRALILAAEDQSTEAVALLREAADAEESLPFTFGPPWVDKPTHELLGEVLLEAGEVDEARAAFATAASRTPGRSLARRHSSER